MKTPPHNPCWIHRVWICLANYRQWRRARILSKATVELWNMPVYGHPENVEAWSAVKTLAIREWDKLFTMDES